MTKMTLRRPKRASLDHPESLIDGVLGALAGGVSSKTILATCSDRSRRDDWNGETAYYPKAR